MLYLSSLLQTNKTYKPAADKLSAALDLFYINYKYINNKKDIWLRDFMPVKSRGSRFVSFRYEPQYLKGYSYLRTDFRNEISPLIALPGLVYSDINLDGGNVVFLPSKDKAIISDRVFSENPEYKKTKLIAELENLLRAQITIIPSLPMKYDMTGHADGMIRFVDENTVIGNRINSINSLEQNIKSVLSQNNISVIDFPYFESRGKSAVGCYLNFLETENVIFLPVFNVKMDNEALSVAQSLYSKEIYPVNINEIAKSGGVLNCISWEWQ